MAVLGLARLHLPHDQCIREAVHFHVCVHVYVRLRNSLSVQPISIDAEKDGHRADGAPISELDSSGWFSAGRSDSLAQDGYADEDG